MAQIGEEKAIPTHLQDGDEFTASDSELIAHGGKLFAGVFTVQDGQGRPLTKGSGAPLSDLTMALLFPRNMNRVSTPDANSCTGCHAQPFGVAGGDGDFVANVFVLAQRFDFATFDHHLSGSSGIPTKSTVDELGIPVTLQSIANSRLTLGMWGSGFIDMLARQMTTDLQSIRDATAPGTCSPLVTKDVSFGEICRNLDLSWNTSGVEGLGLS
ncbi:MAG: di-heme oxidoredictase family protein, partial [Candidatus Binatia bacterium]